MMEYERLEEEGSELYNKGVADLQRGNRLYKDGRKEMKKAKKLHKQGEQLLSAGNLDTWAGHQMEESPFLRKLAPWEIKMGKKLKKEGLAEEELADKRYKHGQKSKRRGKKLKKRGQQEEEQGYQEYMRGKKIELKRKRMSLFE